ncbi:MAG: Outer membrane protein, 28 kDa [Candidatus Collierbacteria bacterium GW2011_GWA2_44_13]|nr:MAG: Outer membrane protein, 28 kDa [Candidatus Collierbacteria bacterium GW2011_GWA2_44_13]
MTKEELDRFIKWVLGGLMVLGALYFFPWGDITWGKIVMKNEAMVTVSGYAESDEKNQIAMFSAGVQAFNDDKEMAVNEVNKKMTEIIKLVKGLGVKDDDIKTQQINTYQTQEQGETLIYPPRPGKVVMGQWSANNTIEITLREVEKAGQLADLLNASGATNVYGPNFQLDTSVKADDKLMGLAVADARKKAEAMAAASGAKLGRVISINESGSGPIYPMMYAAEAAKSALSVPAPVEIGTTKISKTVTVVWSLR